MKKITIYSPSIFSVISNNNGIFDFHLTQHVLWEVVNAISLHSSIDLLH